MSKTPLLDPFSAFEQKEEHQHQFQVFDTTQFQQVFCPQLLGVFFDRTVVETCRLHPPDADAGLTGRGGLPWESRREGRQMEGTRGVQGMGYYAVRWWVCGGWG